MTEFEMASLAVAQLTAWATIAYAVIALPVGAGQIWIIWYGIRRMAENSEARDKDHERRHKEAMKALDAQMLALRTLIERTAPRPAAGEDD